MTIREIIVELQRRGNKVKWRKRTDGGYIITEINNMKFIGAKGNIEARKIIGVELSQARIKQTSFNVEKYIKGKKEKTINESLKKKLRKVQRKMRKTGAKGKISTKKVRWHVREEGEEAATAYLDKMERYAEGYAYYENVEYLAQYCEGVGKGIVKDDELAAKFYKLAADIRAKATTFKEEWINKIYAALYEVVTSGYRKAKAEEIINNIYTIIS